MVEKSKWNEGEEEKMIEKKGNKENRKEEEMK